jgi:hypothetical protein
MSMATLESFYRYDALNLIFREIDEPAFLQQKKQWEGRPSSACINLSLIELSINLLLKTSEPTIYAMVFLYNKYGMQSHALCMHEMI